jgi:hypothetical protein
MLYNFALASPLNFVYWVTVPGICICHSMSHSFPHAHFLPAIIAFNMATLFSLALMTRGT